MMCPLLGGSSSFGVSFVGGFTVSPDNSRHACSPWEIEMAAGSDESISAAISHATQHQQLIAEQAIGHDIHSGSY